LLALKTKPEPEKPLLPNRPKDARDAREVARKLIKSGNINIQKQESQTHFKRPKGQERKKVQNLEPPSYHPFAASEDNSSKSPIPVPEKSDNGNRGISFLYQQFEKEKDTDKKHSPPRDNKPKSGYTIYVSGKSITEDFLKKHFSDYGSIVNVSMEIEKGRGFITFSKTEATDKAIVEVNYHFFFALKTFRKKNSNSFRCMEKL
jgi:negative elongation factor E